MSMQVVVLVLLVVTLGVLVRLCYWRVPLNTAYIRSGAGKPQVLFKGGLVIPGLHQLSGLHLANFSVDVIATRERSLLTSDPLRVDVEMRLLVRIKPSAEAVMTAKTLFDGEVDAIRTVLEERGYRTLSAAVAEFSLQQLLSNPRYFELQLNERLPTLLSDLGIEIMLCSLTTLKPTSQLHYCRSHSVDAKALAVLEAMRMDNMQQVHHKFMETQLQMKQLDFKAAMQQLQWEEAFTAAKLEHERHKAEIEARLTQEIREIEVSKQVALEMIEHDAQQVRIQQAA